MADPLIPTWLPDHHPFYVSSPTAERVRRGFRPNRIFLSIRDGDAHRVEIVDYH